MKDELVYGEKPRYAYCAASHYKEVKNPNDWLRCPKCDMLPLVWEFDNGRSTACGCGKNAYDHFSIHAESCMSALKHSRENNVPFEYDVDELAHNWGVWVRTGEIRFIPNRERW